MATTDQLEISLSKPCIDGRTQTRIVSELWDLGSCQKQYGFPTTVENYAPYFAYNTEQVNAASHDNGRYLSVQTHQEIIDVVAYIKKGSSRRDIKQRLGTRPHHPELANFDEQIDGSIDLTVRVFLMIDIGELKYGFHGRNQLIWDEGSLESWVHRHFNNPQTLQNEHVKLGRIFTARNLMRIGGFEIEWTNNLADHLRILNDDEKKIALFSNFSFLKAQVANSIFPKGFIDETLRTLSLLFPRADPETRKWFRKLSKFLNLDSRASQCDTLRMADRHIDRFHFWRDRLIILKEMFDESEPKNLTQWWSDRRNGVQWYTFWVAIVVLLLTLFFGLV